MLSLGPLLALLIVIAIGAYFQTVTGFGMGMIVMGVASGFDLVSLGTMAAVISLMTLANSVVALPGKLHHIDWRAAFAAMAGIVPATIAGVLLLQYLSGTAANLLRLLLGLVIIHGGVTFARNPVRLASRSPDRSFLVSGVLSGLTDGLFSIAGPPLIFQFYRQPMQLVTVRNMLLLLFAITAGARTVFLGFQDRLSAEIWILTAFAVPVVAVATFAGRRYPPPIAPALKRRIVFSVLILIGLSLVATTLPAVFGF